MEELIEDTGQAFLRVPGMAPVSLLRSVVKLVRNGGVRVFEGSDVLRKLLQCLQGFFFVLQAQNAVDDDAEGF
jgi:hypothetical protein